MIRSRLVAITICMLILAAAPAVHAQLTITEDTNPTCAGCVGVGEDAPSATLHVSRSDGTSGVLIEETSLVEEQRVLLSLLNNGYVNLALVNSASGVEWHLQNRIEGFRLSKAGTGGAEFTLTGNGGLMVGPGTSTSLWLNDTGYLGLGLNLDPSTALHVRQTTGDAQILVEGTGGFTGFVVSNTTSTNGGYWQVTHGAGGAFAIDHTMTLGTTGGDQELRVYDSGLVDVGGGLVTGGNAGIGTDAPSDGDALETRFIDVKSTSTAVRIIADAAPNQFGELLFQEDNTNQWSIGHAGNTNDRFYIYNYVADREDLSIDSATGRAGFGTSAPTTPLDVVASASTIGAGDTVAVLANPNGGAGLKLDSNNDGTNWKVFSIAGESEFRVSRSGSGSVEMKLDSSGNMTITGGLITGTAGSCTATTPCDGLFSPEYTIPSIEEHSAYMWEHWHLPAVGPTVAGEPMNITRKVTGMLNELEKAHVYIEQLHDELREKDAQIVEILSRLERLEAEQTAEK